VAVRGVGPDGEPTVVLVTFGLAREGGVGARMCDSATRVPMPMVQRVVCPGSVTLRAAVLAHTAVRGTERVGVRTIVRTASAWRNST